MKFKFIRLLLGFPIFLLGFIVAALGGWSALGFLPLCAGMFIGVIGLYILCQSFKYELTGIGFILFGIPIYCLGMSDILPYDIPGYLGYKLVLSLIGGIMLMASFNETD